MLIAATSFFVAVEFALVAVERDRVEAAAEAGSRRARIAASLLPRLSFHLSGAQLGITITSLVLGFVAEPAVAEVIAPAVGDNQALAVALALLLVTVFTMVVGELIPKGIAIARPVGTVLALATTMRVYGTVFGPLIRFLNGAADRAVRRLGIEPREELASVRTMEELELLIRSSGEQGTLERQAFELVTKTLRFANKTAADALVPRVDMEVLARDATVADLAEASVDTGFSRFPVVGEDLDDVLGVAHVKDVLRVAPADRATTSIASLVTDAMVVPEGRDLESLLTDLRARRQQLAIVADEHGGVAGLITLEDLLEEIVGDIEDEHDSVADAPRLATLPDGVFIVEGTTHLDDVQSATGLELPDGPYETLAGFLLERLGHLPVPGERVEHEGWRFLVLEMDRHRIAGVRVERPASAHGDDS
ncbi:MAG TPA: hemolysin family protein [Acidimicrobiales bacterium]|nr:hemolysin family protein [Acidimicrobiales bacterium]